MNGKQLQPPPRDILAKFIPKEGGKKSGNVPTPAAPQADKFALVRSCAHTFSASGLPAGLTMASDGTISGTPTETVASKSYTVTVTDKDGHTGTVKLRLTPSGRTLLGRDRTMRIAVLVTSRDGNGLRHDVHATATLLAASAAHRR